MKKRIPWIFFDLDDTLWNFSFNSIESLHYIYREYKLISDKFPDENKFIDTYHLHNAALWDFFARGEISSSTLRPQRWLDTLYPNGFTEEELKNCINLDNAYLKKLSEIPNVIEGAIECLKKITSYGLVGILSNGFPEVQYSKAMNSGLWNYITRIIVSDEINLSKPHPDLFSFAIRETGAVPPFIMVGDNILADILGALRAGWYAIWFNPLKKNIDDAKSLLIKEGVNLDKLIGITRTLDETEQIISNFLKKEIKY